jgi:hypothetical protein
MSKIQKAKLGVKKPKRCDIKWSKPCENQTTHFTNNIKGLNVENSYYNHKKFKTTSQNLLYVYHLPTKGKHK